MRAFLLIAACGLTLSCTAPNSGIGLRDLTRETFGGYKQFERWVEQDLVNRPFPAGLCLKEIKLVVALSDVSTRGGSVGIPLAAPGLGLSGMLNFGGSVEETNGDTITVPFVPVYPAYEQRDHAAAFEHFKTVEFPKQVTVYKDAIGDVPAAIPVPESQRVAFQARSDLAAVLWHIREAIHDGVYRSAADLGSDVDPMLMVPASLVVQRKFKLINNRNAGATIAIAGTGTFAANATAQETQENTITLTYGRNLSKDQMRCDQTSLVEAKTKG